MTYHAAFLLSMVFGYGGLFPLGFCDLSKWKPCLANMRHGCGVVEGCCCPTEASIGSPCCNLLSMVLREIRLLQGRQNTETMLRTTEIAGTTKNTQLCGGVHPPPGCGKTCDYD